jgi:hypothetical protein
MTLHSTNWNPDLHVYHISAVTEGHTDNLCTFIIMWKYEYSDPRINFLQMTLSSELTGAVQTFLLPTARILF